MVLVSNPFFPRSPSGSRRKQACSLALSVLVIIALVGLSQAGWLTGKPQSECLAKNPIIRMLHDKKVKIFNSPKKTTATARTCSWEWDKHQTCCNATSLRAYAVRDIKKLETAVNRVSTNMQKLFKGLHTRSKRIQTSFQRARLQESKLLDRIQKDADGKLAKSLTKALERSRKFKEAEVDLATFQKVVDQKFSEHKFSASSRNDCFERSKAIRTSSLCASCSGDSARFFLQGRALISMDDCKTTITKCGDVWTKSVEMIDTVAVAQRIIRYLKSIYPDDVLPAFPKGDIDTMTKWMGGTQIKEHLAVCSKDVASCPALSAKVLCEAFISVEDREFFKSAGKTLSKTADSLEEPAEAAKPQPAATPAAEQTQPQAPAEPEAASSSRLLMAALTLDGNGSSVLVSRTPPEGHQNMPIQDTFP